ncbi:MAG: hypothetical protein GY696_20760 [Gammaproteobacteria bacterium]|nr:hypothetical protein [Gammaproteobacteria bacterium]
MWLVLSSQEVELKLFNKEKYKSLLAFEQEVKLRWLLQQIGGGFGSRSFTIVKIQGRGEKAHLSTFDGEKELDPGSPRLVLLESKNVLAGAIMYQVHIEMHSDAKYTLATSRRFCWIIAGKQLADQVVKSCPPCRIEWEKRVSPVMCDLSDDRIKPSEPITDVQVDLCSPISILDPRAKTMRSISDKPTWILLAICQFSHAVFLDVLEDYSTDSVLKSMRRLGATFRLPARIILDAGTQLVGARNILKKEYGDRLSWKIVPAQAHHYVGGAERLIGIMKRQLKSKIEHFHMNFNELLLTVQKIAKILNNCPLTVEKFWSLEHWWCITMSDLLGGRASEPLCSWSQTGGSAPKKRLNYLQHKADEFWSVYRQDVLPKLLKAEKWNVKTEPLKIGDIVLVKNQNPLERSFRPGRIISLEVREQGKKSRNALCRFKLNANSPTRDHEVSLRRLFRINLQDCVNE